MAIRDCRRQILSKSYAAAADDIGGSVAQLEGGGCTVEAA